jgi:hypothetical protein
MVVALLPGSRGPVRLEARCGRSARLRHPRAQHGPVPERSGKAVARFVSIWRRESPGVWRIVSIAVGARAGALSTARLGQSISSRTDGTSVRYREPRWALTEWLLRVPARKEGAA